jgi:DUF2075 family protein
VQRPLKDGSFVWDVQIGGWSRRGTSRRALGRWRCGPVTTRAAVKLGCVYTAQGFEYEWNGALLGPDLVWRNDRWVAVHTANCDPDFKNTKQVSGAEFDVLVRNFYKVLLIRGSRGVYLYSTDPETQQFLDALIN